MDIQKLSNQYDRSAPKWRRTATNISDPGAAYAALCIWEDAARVLAHNGYEMPMDSERASIRKILRQLMTNDQMLAAERAAAQQEPEITAAADAIRTAQNDLREAYEANDR